MDFKTFLTVFCATGGTVGLIVFLVTIRRYKNKSLEKLLYSIISKLNQIQMTNEAALQQLTALTTQVGKIKTEVQNLIDAGNNAGNVSPEVEAAIFNMKTATTEVDDLNADA